MRKNPVISVICLCYNHDKFVTEALDSVLNQSYSNIELIIADDCSTDNSQFVIQQWLETHPGILFLTNEKNLGNTKTFNNAVKHAKGEYIIDLAADDVLLSFCIEKQIEAFMYSNHKNLGVVYGNIIQMNENGNYRNDYYTDKDKPQSGNIYKMVISGKPKICSVGSMIKRSVFETVGYYDENLMYEDLDLWVRASRVFSFEYLPDILVKKREFETNLTAHFSKKFNVRTRRISYSTYVILQKAYKLNCTKDEDYALLHRINHEIEVTSRNFNFDISFKLFWLKLKTQFKKR